MKSVDALIKKTMEFRDKGLSEKEIADELHLSENTVNWLLTHGVKGEPPNDVKIGWRSVGIFGSRISCIAGTLSDIILEEMEKRESDFDVVVGIAINGIPYSVFISENLGAELAVFRPATKSDMSGTFSSNYAGVKGKNVVVVDDVISTGESIRGAVSALRENGAKPVLVVVVVNKTTKDEIEGVPVRALIRARTIA